MIYLQHFLGPDGIGDVWAKRRTDSIGNTRVHVCMIVQSMHVVCIM